MNLRRERARWLLAFLTVAALITATMLISDVVFQTNDDNHIVSSSCGGVTGSPYPGNGFTGYLYGLMLSSLYTLSSDIPWHGLLLMSVQCLSLIAVLRSLWFLCDKKRLSPLWGLLGFLALYIGVGVKFITHLQFTAAPGFCAAALAALLWTLPDGRRARRFSLVLGFALMAFALLLRFKGGLLALPVPIMVGGIKLLEKERNSRSVAALGIALGLFTVGAFGLDGLLYRTNEQGWEAQAAFDEASAVLLDYHNDDATYALAEQVTDWSPELIRCLRNWNLFIDERFNTENLTKLAQAIEANEETPSLYALLYKTGSIIRRYSEFGVNALVMGLLSLWALFRFISRRRPWRAVLLMGLGASTLAVIAYFYGFLGRFPDRVAFAYAWPVYVMALALFFEACGDSSPRERGIAPIGAALLLAAGLTALLPQWKDVMVLPDSGRQSRAALTRSVNSYAAEHPGTVFVTDATQGFFAFELCDAPVNLLEWGNAMIRSPMYRQKFEVIGYPDGLTTGQLADERVRLLLCDTAALSRLMDCVNADIAPWQAVAEEDLDVFKVYRLE